MTDTIELDGTGRARLVRRQVLHEGALADLAPHLTTRLPTTLPVLPQNPTRFAHFDPETGTGLFLIETPPRLHHMRVAHYSGRHPTDQERQTDGNVGVFKVQLPWQYFAYSVHIAITGSSLRDFSVRESFLYWARDPIRSTSDKMFPALCPNVDEAGSICWGQTQSDSSSLSAQLDDLVNNFFTTTFNEDLGHFTPFGFSLTEWEADSEDPLAHRAWPIWEQDNGLTALEVHEALLNREPTNIANLNPAYVALPTLPHDFTVARAREWWDSLDEGAQRRLSAALALEPAEATA
jgi:hypothetical protein